MSAARLTVRRLMAVIAALAVVLAACRANLFLGIFLGCVASGTYARSSAAIARRLREGHPVTLGQKARVVASSILVTTIILGLADGIALAGMFYGTSWPQPGWCQVGSRGSELSFYGGPALALIAASRLGRRLWSCEIHDDPPRPSPGRLAPHGPASLTEYRGGWDDRARA